MAENEEFVGTAILAMELPTAVVVSLITEAEMQGVHVERLIHAMVVAALINEGWSAEKLGVSLERPGQ